MPTQTPILGLYNPLDADDANTAVRVWRTADNAVLDDAVLWARVPRCRVYHTADQSIPNAVGTALVFNAERFDTDAIHDTVSSTGRLTCRTAGLYLVGFNGAWAPSGGGSLRQFQLRLNGGTLLAVQDGTPATVDLSVTTLVAMAVSDYVEVVAYHNAGTALAVQATPWYSAEFWMVRVG